MPKRIQIKSQQLSFDTRTGRYHDSVTGRFVKQATIQATLERTIQKHQSAIEILSADLRASRISLRTWRSEMVSHIKQTQSAEYILGRGGWMQMTKGDYGKLGALLKKQYQYLNRFVEQMQKKYDSPSELDGRFSVRAKMYAEAGRATYQNARHTQMDAAGFTQERRLLGAAEHCPTCLAEAELGWMPIGTLRPIGDSECMVLCKCQFEYRSAFA